MGADRRLLLFWVSEKDFQQMLALMFEFARRIVSNTAMGNSLSEAERSDEIERIGQMVARVLNGHSTEGDRNEMRALLSGLEGQPSLSGHRLGEMIKLLCSGLSLSL